MQAGSMYFKLRVVSKEKIRVKVCYRCAYAVYVT